MAIHTDNEGIRVKWWHHLGFDARQHCGSEVTQMLSCLKLQVMIKKQGAGFVQMHDGHMTINQHLLHFLMK